MGSSVLVIKQRTSPSRNKPTHRSLSIPCQDVLSESPCCCPDCGQPGPSSLPTEERDDSQYFRQFFPPDFVQQCSPDCGWDRSLHCPRHCAGLHPPRYPRHRPPGYLLSRGREKVQQSGWLL